MRGDIEDTCDSVRITSMGVSAVQINTGSACHLDASMIKNALSNLTMEDLDILIIENVGNLVCPSMFDLGESKRVVIISTTEGEDKPIKYPDMFFSSDICIINKIDLLPYLNFDIEKLKDYAKQVNPKLEFFEVSATTGEGMDKWYSWLKNNSKTA